MLREANKPISARLAPLWLGLTCAAFATLGALAAAGPVFTTAPTQLRNSARPLGELSLPVQQGLVDAGDRQIVNGALRRLPNSAQGFRVQGENGVLEWPLFLTQTQAASPTRLQVSFQTAASVMPEASSFIATVNDVAVGTIAIGGSRDFRTVRFDVPSELLKPGYNAVRLTVNQRHRVDCSVEATFELWTQIDPFASGLLVASDRVGSLAELPALPLDLLGGISVRLRAPSTVDRAWRVRAVQALALAAGVKQTRVLDDNTGAGATVDLYVGTATELAASLRFAATSITGPTILFRPADANEPTRVVVTGRDGADVDAALRQLAAARPSLGALPGLRALRAFDGAEVSGGESVGFGDAGIGNQKFTGRMFRAGLNIRLPADFYPADNAKAVLHLAGAYAPGLSRASQIVLNVNGKKAISVRLGSSAGEVFANNAVPVPLSQFRPGLNRFEIEAQVPASSDARCAPATLIESAARFLLFSSTELEFPRLARAWAAPELGVTMAGGVADARVGDGLRIVTPAGDRGLEAAAYTIAARMGAESGRLLDIDIADSDAGDRSRPTLVLAAARELRDEDALAVNLPGVVAALPTVAPALDGRGPAGRAAVLAQDAPLACAGLKAVDSAAVVARRGKAAFDMTPIASIGARGFNSVVATAVSRARDVEQRSDDLLTRLTGSVLDVIGLPFASEGAAPNAMSARAELADRRLILAQSAASRRMAPITIITAADRDALRAGVDCMIDTRVWSQARGEFSVINPTTGAIFSQSAQERSIVSIRPWTFENIRLVAATWLSLHKRAYVASTMGAAVLLAFATARLLDRTGRGA